MKSAKSKFAVAIGLVSLPFGVAFAARGILAPGLAVLNGRPISANDFLVGICGGLLIALSKYLLGQPDRENAARQRREEAEARRAAEQARIERDLAAQAALRARTLGLAEEAVFDARSSAAQLPVILAEAELALDRAEQELEELLPSPFWEAIEDAALRLSDFENTLRAIDRNREEHVRLTHALGGDAPEFRLGISVLPDPANTNQRINGLFRRAQKVRDFPIIYEQRRTNTILIDGFRSLGNAIASLGAQLRIELAALGDKLDAKMSDLESALRDSASQLAEQHREQIAIVDAARSDLNDFNAERAQIARERLSQGEKRANESREFETVTLRMLDKLQRRTKTFRS